MDHDVLHAVKTRLIVPAHSFRGKFSKFSSKLSTNRRCVTIYFLNPQDIISHWIWLFRNHALALSLLLCARQSLWFDSIVSNCVLSEALGRYPTISASGLPPQKNFKVGKPWTPYWDAILGSCSTFTFTNANRPTNSVDSESKSGISRLHQGHQGAQKSTITGTEDWSTSLSHVAESASTTISLHNYLFLLLEKLPDKLLVYEFSEGGVELWFHFFFSRIFLSSRIETRFSSTATIVCTRLRMSDNPKSVMAVESPVLRVLTFNHHYSCVAPKIRCSDERAVLFAWRGWRRHLSHR